MGSRWCELWRRDAHYCHRVVIQRSRSTFQRWGGILCKTDFIHNLWRLTRLCCCRAYTTITVRLHFVLLLFAPHTTYYDAFGRGHYTNIMYDVPPLHGRRRWSRANAALFYNPRTSARAIIYAVRVKNRILNIVIDVFCINSIIAVVIFMYFFI